MRRKYAGVALRCRIDIGGLGEIRGECALVGADFIGIVKLHDGERAARVPGSADRLSELLELTASSAQGVQARTGVLAVEVFAQNDIDHAADRIGAVNGGG